MIPMIEVLPGGFLLSVENISYSMSWVGDLFKVEGPQVCYYLKEVAVGLAQIDCITLKETIIVLN
jgi:hypothetical protein